MSQIRSATSNSATTTTSSSNLLSRTSSSSNSVSPSELFQKQISQIVTEFNNDLRKAKMELQNNQTLRQPDTSAERALRGLVRFLIDAGLVVPVLLWACSEGHEELCRLILENYENNDDKMRLLNPSESTGLTGLMLAASNGHADVCQYLIQQKASVETVRERQTALSLACRNGHPNVCRLLFENQTEPFKSCYLNNVTDSLLTKENVNAQTADTQVSLLMIGSSLGFKDLCKVLLEKGANVNLQDHEKETALIKAARNDHQEICKLLIEHRADLEVRNIRNDTAFSLAELYKYEGLCRVLKGEDNHETSQNTTSPTNS